MIWSTAMDAGTAADFLSAVGTVGAVAVAMVAVVVNGVLTHRSLASQEETAKQALSAQAQFLRDELVWKPRIDLYERVVRWADDCVGDIRSLKFWWYEPEARRPEPEDHLASDAWVQAGAQVQDKHWAAYVELRSLVNLYGQQPVREAFEDAVPNPLPLAGQPIHFDDFAKSIQVKDEQLESLKSVVRECLNEGSA